MTSFQSSALKRLAGVALALGMAHGAQALTVFNNGAPNQLTGVNMSSNVVAEDFTLLAATNITNFRFWSIQDTPGAYTGSLQVSVYSNVGGSPGVVVASGTGSLAATATGASTAFGYAEYVFDIPVAATLGAGTYWLAIANFPLNPINPSEMLWETTSGGLGSTAKYLQGASWIDALEHLAFRVDGTLVGGGNVPEPSTLALLAVALAGAAVMRRRV